MAAIPANVTRVSDSLRWSLLSESLTRHSLEQLRMERQISTGERISVASDDPRAGRVVLALQRALEESAQYLDNLRHGRAMLAATDAALADVADYARQAQTLAQQEASLPANSTTREGAALVVSSIIDGLLAVVNRRHAGQFLFGGLGSEAAPFELLGPGVRYNGSDTAATVAVGAGQYRTVSITGAEAFDAWGGLVDGSAELTPLIGRDTLLASLNRGAGVAPGSILVSDGTNSTVVDLSSARDVGDLIDLMNAAPPGTTTVSIDPAANALRIESTLPGADITVEDLPGGTTARNLGLLTPPGGSGGDTFTGTSLDPVLTPLTPLDDLRAGAGFDRTSGMLVSNGPYSAVVDLTGCLTVEDLLNRINTSGCHVEARIAPEGDRLQVVSLISGTELSIGENGGTTAADLGLRTLDLSTPLADLNRGRGVDIVEGGSDLVIRFSDGTSAEVDLAGAVTVGDVLARIEAAAPGRIDARLADVGNGIRLEDLTGGTGPFAVESAPGGRTTAADLGLWKEVQPPSAVITGDDVNPVVAENLFTHLVELRRALLEDDEQAIAEAARLLAADADAVTQVRGTVGVRINGLQSDEDWLRGQRLVDQEFLSQVRDLDYSVAVAQFAAVNTFLEATLRTAASVGKLSLLDYL